MFRASLIILALASCSQDETLSAYGASDKVWVLTSIDGAKILVEATLTFPEPGKIAGQAPCNSYFAAQNAPYPWFEVGSIAMTKRACPSLTEEAAFVNALSEMTISEVSGDTLILSNDAKRKMVFKAR